MKRILLLTALVLLLAFWQIIPPLSQINVTNFELFDPDCYMRLVRVEQLNENQNWFDNVIHRSNTPMGETLHWTRLLDIILLAGAYLGAPLVGFKTALFWWGVLVSPVLQLISLPALYWAAWPIFRQNNGLRLCLLFLGQAGIWSYYYIGRPDHHSLLLFLFIVFLGFAIRMVIWPNQRRYAWWAGLTTATAIWVSVESLTVAVMAMATLTILWLTQRRDHEQYAQQSFSFCVALLGGCIVYLFVERPLFSIMAVEYDRISVAHIVLFLIPCIFWVIMRRVWLVGAGWRWGAVVFLAVTGAAVIKFMFPAFFHGPYAAVDPRIVPLWLNTVKEVQPLLAVTPAGLVKLILLLGPAIVAIPYMLAAIARGTTLDRDEVLLTTGIIIFVPLSLYQLRWSAYAETVLLFPVVMLLNVVVDGLDLIVKKSGLRAFARVMVTLLFCVGFFVVGTLLTPAELKAEQTAHTITPAVEFLNDPQGLGASSKTILADMDFGPEILYRTRHKVIATPYHRNGAGIMFVYEVMTAPTDAEALSLLKERAVDVVLLYPSSSEKVFFLNTTNNDTFYKRLLAGQYPVWLKPANVPVDLVDKIKVFEVIR